MAKYAYLHQSKNDRARVYDYYCEVLSYPKRYPEVYGEVFEVNKSSDALEVEVRAPLETTSESGPFIARFTFHPQSEIRYEVINGYGKGEIKKSILIKESSDHVIRLGCTCEVEVNHLPLDIMRLDPHALDTTNPLHMRYIETVSYLSERSGSSRRKSELR